MCISFCCSICLYEQQNIDGVVAVQTIRPSETNQYGVVELEVGGGHRIKQVVEKPTKDQAPSNLGVVGRYILPAEIFSVLENTETGAGGEIQLTDAISSLLSSLNINAYLFEGKRYDCGNKLGYLQANIEYALKNDEIGDQVRAYLKKLDI